MESQKLSFVFCSKILGSVNVIVSQGEHLKWLADFDGSLSCLLCYNVR